MKTFKLSIKYIAIALIFLNSCKKDDKKAGENKDIFHEEELITSVELILQDSSRNTIDTVAFRDVDGIGGLLPTIDSIYLVPNSLYSVQVRFLDESNPQHVEDISYEIEMEADEHLICYQTEDLEGMQIEITDTDGKYPLGLKSLWEIDSVNQQNGSIQIKLKHQPGVKNGSCGVGDTDIEVSFPTTIR